MSKPLRSTSEGDPSAPALPAQRAKKLGGPLSHSPIIESSQSETTGERRELSRNDPPPSTRIRAATFLRQVRDAGEWNQEAAAVVAGVHPTTLGDRERAQVSLGAFEQALAMLGELARQRGPEAMTDALLKLGASIERAAAMKKAKEGSK